MNRLNSIYLLTLEMLHIHGGRWHKVREKLRQTCELLSNVIDIRPLWTICKQSPSFNKTLKSGFYDLGRVLSHFGFVTVC